MLRVASPKKGASESELQDVTAVNSPQGRAVAALCDGSASCADAGYLELLADANRELACIHLELRRIKYLVSRAFSSLDFLPSNQCLCAMLYRPACAPAQRGCCSFAGRWWWRCQAGCACPLPRTACRRGSITGSSSCRTHGLPSSPALCAPQFDSQWYLALVNKLADEVAKAGGSVHTFAQVQLLRSVVRALAHFPFCVSYFFVLWFAEPHASPGSGKYCYGSACQLASWPNGIAVFASLFWGFVDLDACPAAGGHCYRSACRGRQRQHRVDTGAQHGLHANAGNAGHVGAQGDLGI